MVIPRHKKLVLQGMMVFMPMLTFMSHIGNVPEYYPILKMYY
jgi:hypothetical protein